MGFFRERKMKKVECIIQRQKVSELLQKLNGSKMFHGVTEMAVRGCGRQMGRLPSESTTDESKVYLRTCSKLEFAVPDNQVEDLVKIIVKVNQTGKSGAGDGKIFISPLEDVVRISSGERGEKGVV
jgi:nitrogen regulatory protein P-II 1